MPAKLHRTVGFDRRYLCFNMKTMVFCESFLWTINGSEFFKDLNMIDKHPYEYQKSRSSLPIDYRL